MRKGFWCVFYIVTLLKLAWPIWTHNSLCKTIHTWIWCWIHSWCGFPDSNYSRQSQLCILCGTDFLEILGRLPVSHASFLWLVAGLYPNAEAVLSTCVGTAASNETPTRTRSFFDRLTLKFWHLNQSVWARLPETLIKPHICLYSVSNVQQRYKALFSYHLKMYFVGRRTQQRMCQLCEKQRCCILWHPWLQTQPHLSPLKLRIEKTISSAAVKLF